MAHALTKITPVLKIHNHASLIHPFSHQHAQIKLLGSRSHTIVPRATSDGSSEASTSSNAESSPNLPPRIRTTPPPGRNFPPPPPGALTPDMQLQKVEKLGKDSIAGVAAVDRGDGDNTSIGKALKLAAGDAVALLVFATIGRFNHHEGLSLGGSFETALPFLLGWFLSAPFLGGFGKDAQSGDVGAAVGTAAKSWAAALPLGLLIRSVLKGYVPDKSFIIVSAIATAVLLIGGRAAQAATSPKPDKNASRRNRRGNPFEFLSLLTSLVKRW